MENSKKAAAPVKVVIIEFHHIHTDVSNFKSVVQSLTRKRSSTAVHSGGDTRPKRQRRQLDETIITPATTTTSFLQSASSFKDLDRLLKLDLPSMEDLTWIWDD